MEPNNEQIKSAVRWLITTFGGIIAASGIFGSAGDQVLGILNSEFFIGLAVSAIGLVWGLFAHTTSNAVAIAAAVPQVKQVVVYPTQAGKALAEKVGSKPDAVVAVAPNR